MKIAYAAAILASIAVGAVLGLLIGLWFGAVCALEFPIFTSVKSQPGSPYRETLIPIHSTVFGIGFALLGAGAAAFASIMGSAILATILGTGSPQRRN